jgi:NifB/MoaA-like Fe-S oxidoreductase
MNDLMKSKNELIDEAIEEFENKITIFKSCINALKLEKIYSQETKSSDIIVVNNSKDKSPDTNLSKINNLMDKDYSTQFGGSL